jgi:hypothetical protein
MPRSENFRFVGIEDALFQFKTDHGLRGIHESSL